MFKRYNIQCMYKEVLLFCMDILLKSSSKFIDHLRLWDRITGSVRKRQIPHLSPRKSVTCHPSGMSVGRVYRFKPLGGTK